jgi:thiamine biosynthesis lipoprotein ApbE
MLRSLSIYFLGLCLFVSHSLFAKEPIKEKKTAQMHIAHYENVLGTSLEIKTSVFFESQATIAEQTVLNEIERLSKILSGYDANSEFSKWMNTHQQAVRVSKELFSVLHLFDEWRIRTNGALDPSAEIVNKVWKEAAAKSTLPSQEILNKAIAEVKQVHWILDEKNQTATHISNAPLKLNSFAKSYIIQSAVNAAMNATDLNGIIVNIGGDMVIKGSINEKIWISNPKADAENDAPIDQLFIQGKAIATSGNYRRGELINGQWFSHIVDPRTALPAGEIISATVVSNSATDAGALATAFNVMYPSESIAMAENMIDVDFLIITKNGERFESKNWKKLEAILPTNTSLKNGQKDWTKEIVIGLELAPQTGYAKRPFAAIWIEDKDQKTVKTIALWYNKGRWLPDLRDWYRKNGSSLAADPNTFVSITSSTRSPGKYTMKWDGKDEKGVTLKPGKYTVHIEVAREHGGYDLLEQELNCSSADQQFTLKGNSEVGAVNLAYKIKSTEN